MTRRIGRRLRGALDYSADRAVDFWNRLPGEPPGRQDNAVLAIFAGAAGASMFTAVALIALSPR